MRHPEVQRVVAQVLVVGADIERDGQAERRGHATARGIERKFADRDAHAVCAQIAQAKDAFAVGDHNHPHVGDAASCQISRDSAPVLGRNIQAARAAENMAVFLARLPDGGRVDAAASCPGSSITTR